MIQRQQNQGFTLIEVAIVFVIIAALLSYVFMPLRAQKETAYIMEARAKLAEIEEALYGFAIANGRLPCPTQPGLNGLENPVIPAAHCNNAAAIGGYIGFVPASTLGIKGKVNCDGLLLDPWGRPYRYSVTNFEDPAPAIDQGVFVVAGGIALAASFTPTPSLGNIIPDIRVCNDLTVACTGAVGVPNSTSNAVAVIFSMGTRERPNRADENENAGEGGTVASACALPGYPIANDRFYYAAERVEIVGQEFDDQLIWISPNLLYSKLLQAGHPLQ